MKILWFSNSVLSSQSIKGTGSWLYSMSRGLIDKGVELYNITQFGKDDDVAFINDMGIKEWVFPITNKFPDLLPDNHIIDQIVRIVNDIAPDIIHVWGIEAYWGLLISRGYISGYKTLLEMQGLYSACGLVYNAFLSRKEQVKCLSIKEVLRPRLYISSQKHRYNRLGEKHERELISSYGNIAVQSKWVENQIRYHIPADCSIFHSIIGLRKEFLSSDAWIKPTSSRHIVMTVYGGTNPYKGKHDVIKAIGLLKEDFPSIMLKIVGVDELGRPRWKQSGYFKYLKWLISSLNLEDNVVFTGPKDASALISEFYSSNLVVHSSYVESYSLCLAEAMALGVPNIISFAGAMTELAENEISALFYPMGDYVSLAAQIRRLLLSDELSGKIGMSAREIALTRNDCNLAVENQISIYKKILNASNDGRPSENRMD